jgi:hypothetical protein
METNATPEAFPVNYDVDRQLADRNRLTVFFRLILAIPHLILVGGPGISGFGSNFRRMDNFAWFGSVGSSGVLGLVAAVMSIVSWFAIVITGKQPRGLWDFTAFYLRWRSKAVAYTALLRDEYPPFGEGDYPAHLNFSEFPTERNRVSVGFRIFLLIPHFIALFFVGIAWAITAFIAWLIILFTGAYPESLYNFAVGYLRWSLRVESFGLLMHDKFPPFSFD